jgi:hypothetical protein
MPDASARAGNRSDVKSPLRTGGIQALDPYLLFLEKLTEVRDGF